MPDLAASLAMTAALCTYEGAVYATGVATSLDSGEIQYCEYHLPSVNNSRRVLYYSASGHKIAEKYVTGIDNTRPQFQQHDIRQGEERQISLQGQRLKLAYRKNATAPWQFSLISARDVDVADAGFDVFVREQWAHLAAGRTVQFQFASPLHGRSIKLRARKIPCRESDTPSLCLKVDLAQPLLRIFVGDLYLVYDKASRRLRLFEGVVNLLSDSGISQRLTIHYSY
ncbi:hypothetical protein [Microbulbifer sp. TYP-18]|uniref:hypothetical protein n=1 Tax=Microbulbifer sp. TYP-18 TaxID=3230024 RepID=UPI0034C6D725